MVYCSALEILEHATKWMKLEDMVRSEISQSIKNKYGVSFLEQSSS